MHSVAVFDDGLGLLSPLTDLRAVFDVRTGALTTLERMTLRARLGHGDGTGGAAGLFVPEFLARVTGETHRGMHVNDPGKLSGTVLMVNGACVLADWDEEGLACGEAIVDGATGVIAQGACAGGA